MSKNLSEHWTFDSEKLESFVLHRLDAEEANQLRTHLEQCHECRLRVQEERELIAGVRRFGRMKLKRMLKQRIRRDRSRRFEWTQVTSLAAAIVLMVGAVFAIRWLTDSDMNNSRTRQIALKDQETSQRPMWIIGKIIVQEEKSDRSSFKGNTSFNIRQGNLTQSISIRRVGGTKLPPSMRNEDEHSVRTLLERTPQGIQLTLYTDIMSDSLATRVKAITADSLIVFYQGIQIAYHIPGGWAGRM